MSVLVTHYKSYFLHRDSQKKSHVSSVEYARKNQPDLNSIFTVCTFTALLKSTYNNHATSNLSALLGHHQLMLSYVDVPFHKRLRKVCQILNLCNFLFQLLEENIVAFVTNELKRIQRILSPDYPDCLEVRSEEEEEVGDSMDEQQRRSCREAFLNITLQSLRAMKQEELANSLQNSKTF